MNDALSPNLRLIGRYAVLRELRRDRASVTYIAMDPVMHREVILKAVQLPPPATQTESNEAQISALEAAFVRQAQAAGKLHHPHIVTVFDAGRVHHVAYLAIERVAGRPLHELLASGWRPEFIHCASIAARIADALEYAHSQDVAHGHLGPQHVLLQADGSPKIEGFGGWIDSGISGEEALARTERLLPYFQNELTEESRHNDVRSIAALLHMLLTGKAPQRESDTRMRPVLSLRPDVPPALARLVDETLTRNNAAAVRTAADLRDALTAFLWNERKAHVAPGTIGIPLAAPPAERPSDPAQAKFPPSSSAASPSAGAPARMVVPPAPVRPRTDEVAAEASSEANAEARAETSAARMPAPSSTQRITPAVTAPGARAATTGAAAGAAASSAAGATAAGAVAAAQPDETTLPRASSAAAIQPPRPATEASIANAAVDLARLTWQRARVAAQTHRVALSAVGGLVVIGIVIGIVLAQFAGRGPRQAALDATQAPVITPRPATGIVILEITPWGEVLVDAKPVGVSPPLSQLTLPVGRHAIEIRHGDKTAVAAEVTVDSAQPQRLRHHFQ
jgi:serine/threonine-protein kinase